MATQQYVVALPREGREDAPADWVEQVNSIDGVSVVGATARRAQVAADDEGIARLRESFGSKLLIEPAIPHYPTGEDAGPGIS